MRRLAVFFTFFIALVIHAADAPPATAVQIDLSKIVNSRGVATLVDGKVVPLQINGGVITQEAAAALGSKSPHCVPNDGKFAANADHPEVILPYATAGAGNHVRLSTREDDYSFNVPAKNYVKMFLFFTSYDSGAAALHITLTYQDGSTETRDIVVPDWYKDLVAVDKGCFYLASDLGKWSTDNKQLEVEPSQYFGHRRSAFTGQGINAGQGDEADASERCFMGRDRATGEVRQTPLPESGAMSCLFILR